MHFRLLEKVRHRLEASTDPVMREVTAGNC